MEEDSARSLLALTGAAESALAGLEAPRWHERLERRQDEFGPAVEWLIAAGSPDDALRLVVALPYFWMANGNLAGGRALLERAAGVAGAPPGLRALARFHAGMLATFRVEHAASAALFARALAHARQAGDSDAVALALSGQARLALVAGDIPRGERLSLEALDLAGDGAGRSNALHTLGQAARLAGDLERARAVMTARLELARDRGNLVAVATEATNLSSVERELGRDALAAELLAEASRLWPLFGRTLLVMYVASVRRKHVA